VLASCAGAALVLTWPSEGRCEDLQASAARVAETWRDAGAIVARDDARFLNEGESLTLSLSAGPESPCQTVALIGARGLSFHARVGDAGGQEDSDERVSSVAGVLEIRSCGAEPFRFVRLTSDAGRGAVETVIGRSADPLPAATSALLERTGGVLPPPPEPGALPPLPSPEKRAEVAETRARRDGAKTAPREAWTAGADGKGEGRLVLEAGCHRVELFAPESFSSDLRLTRPSPRPGIPGGFARRMRLDLDATLRDEDGLVLAHDHTSAPDARIDVCVGEATTTSVLFEGAPPGSPVLTTHASSPLPEHLPMAWGRGTRARMAAALLPRHVGVLPGDAVLLAQGASGLTPVPIPVEPGACYVAVAAMERGHARGLGLRVVIGARESVDERGTNDESTAVAFCAGDRDRVRLEVEARSTGVSWGLALFRVASSVWERTR
jgi:hypothetical protein